MVLQARKADVPAGDVEWKVRMRVCAWYSWLSGTPPAVTACNFEAVFGPDAIKAPAIRSLFRQFRDGHKEMCDLKRSGRPAVSTSANKIQEVKTVVTDQPRSTIASLARRTGLKYSSANAAASWCLTS